MARTSGNVNSDEPASIKRAVAIPQPDGRIEKIKAVFVGIVNVQSIGTIYNFISLGTGKAGKQNTFICCLYFQSGAGTGGCSTYTNTLSMCREK